MKAKFPTNHPKAIELADKIRQEHGEDTAQRFLRVLANGRPDFSIAVATRLDDLANWPHRAFTENEYEILAQQIMSDFASQNSKIGQPTQAREGQ